MINGGKEPSDGIVDCPNIVNNSWKKEKQNRELKKREDVEIVKNRKNEERRKKERRKKEKEKREKLAKIKK